MVGAWQARPMLAGFEPGTDLERLDGARPTVEAVWLRAQVIDTEGAFRLPGSVIAPSEEVVR
jgi:hypothetical protein